MICGAFQGALGDGGSRCARGVATKRTLGSWLDIDGSKDYALALPFSDNAYMSDLQTSLGNSGLFEVESIDPTVSAIVGSQFPARSQAVLIGSLAYFSKTVGGGAYGTEGVHAAVLDLPMSVKDSQVSFRS